MDEYGDLQNGVRVPVDKLYLIVVEKSLEEVAGRESKPTLEERGEHHNLCCIGCGNVFSGGGVPLQRGAIGEKRIGNKFANFFLICDGRLKEVRMRSCHGWSEGVRWHGMRAKAQAETAKNFGGKNGGGKTNARVGAVGSLMRVLTPICDDLVPNMCDLG
jgi:hypothetical protein